jgi:glycosyltransferase involved in cell wall biosynthesis
MKFSIILPVKNGERYVGECVSGILGQSVGDFELIILENASTDNTLGIIHSFNDDRIRIYSTGSPLTIDQNWQRALNVPKNEFMTLIGYDDILNKDYLFVMNDLIEKYPNASLFQTHFRYIDSEGKEIGKCQPMAEMQMPAEAVHNFLCNKTDLMGTGFMMRSSHHDLIGGIPPYPNLLFADMQLWIELSRKSYLAVDKRECFSYRKHLAATTSVSSDAKYLESFELLVNYLSDLRESDPGLASVISNDSSYLLRQYCQGITHKILRTPKNMRQTPGVTEIIDLFRLYGRRLGNENFEPLDYRSIRLGNLVDNNSLLHSLFLLFKKIYSKPILKD